MGLLEIKSLARIPIALRNKIMSAKTKEELISLSKSCYLGNGGNEPIVDLFNSRMREIMSSNLQVTQLRQQISSATSIHEINQLLTGRSFTVEESSLLQGIVSRKIAELQNGNRRLSHPSVANLEQVKTTLGSMFERSYTLDEANEAARAYREAFVTTDTCLFMTKIFRQLLKDYRFNMGDIPAKTADCGSNFAQFNILTGLEIDHGAIYRSQVNKSHIFKCLAHELKHASQHRIECGTDFIEYIKAEVINNFKEIETSPMAQHFLRENNGNIQHAMAQMEVELIKLILPCFKNAEKIPKTSPLYSHGLALIENTKNYKRWPKYSYNEYKGQLLEKEAFRVGNLAESLYELLINA